MRKLFLMLMIVLAMFIIPASAENFTKIIPSTDTVIINQTYTRSDNPNTPLVIFILMAISGIVLLGLSFIMKPEHCNDIMGYIAPIPLFFSAIMSLGLDIRTSAGVASTYADNTTKLLLIENHTIYTHPLVIIFLVIVFLISLLNILRVNRQHKELQFDEQQEYDG